MVIDDSVVRGTTAGPLVQLGALIVLTMPIAPAMFVDVALRRELVIVPFLAMFVGIAVAEILRLSRRRRTTRSSSWTT